MDANVRLLTVPEYCERYRCSTSTARRRIDRRNLQVVQPGGKRTKVLIIDCILPDDDEAASGTTSPAPIPSPLNPTPITKPRCRRPLWLDE